MKRILLITALLVFTAWTSQAAQDDKCITRTDSCITFVVDEGLKPVEKSQRRKSFTMNGEELAKSILSVENVPGEPAIVTSSFADADNLGYLGKDAFFQCLITAYANHQSLVLSPDMVWLLISQGFARYVNAHPEDLRPQLVNHEGQMKLTVKTTEDLFSGNPDWERIMEDFSDSIKKYTKGEIAQTLTADFSTTTPTTRIASDITLMESMKSYFEYVVMRMACGIPTITLQGTPEDWQSILDRTKRLGKYGLQAWVDDMVSILTEFVRTAEGTPNQKFWQSMVKKNQVEKLEGGACIPSKPTELDGWMLKLFPDEEGKTLDKVSHTKDMPSEMVCVDFKYQVVTPDLTILEETPMELWAGFIGAEVDEEANTLTPKIGWMVRKSEKATIQLDNLKKKNRPDGWWIHLSVKEVPKELAELKHIYRLWLVFTDKVVLPEWMDTLTIDEFRISGSLTEAEKEKIQKRFPGVVIEE